MDTPAPRQKVLGRRVVAALVDLVPLAVVGALLGDTSGDDGSFSVQLDGAPLLLWGAIVLGYYFVMEVALGATIGKLLIGLRVQTEDGGSATTGQVAIRTGLRIVDVLPFLYLVGFVTAAVTQRDQRLGDLAAHTEVVRAD